jgi:hypothetical protein
MKRALALLGLAPALALSACSPTIGAGCVQSTDCSSQGNRVCDTSQPEGYCTVIGCADNSCPDHAVCVTFGVALPGCGYNDYQAPSRTSLTLCLEHCKSDSDCRAAEGYVCIDPTAAPLSGRILDDNQNQKVCVVAATPVGPQQDAAGVCSAGRVLPEASGGDGAGAEEAGAPDASPPTDSSARDAADTGLADGPDPG